MLEWEKFQAEIKLRFRVLLKYNEILQNKIIIQWNCNYAILNSITNSLLNLHFLSAFLKFLPFQRFREKCFALRAYAYVFFLWKQIGVRAWNFCFVEQNFGCFGCLFHFITTTVFKNTFSFISFYKRFSFFWYFKYM